MQHQQYISSCGTLGHGKKLCSDHTKKTEGSISLTTVMEAVFWGQLALSFQICYNNNNQ